MMKFILSMPEELYYFPSHCIGQEDFTHSSEKGSKQKLGTLAGYEAAKALIDKMGWGLGKVDGAALQAA